MIKFFMVPLVILSAGLCAQTVQGAVIGSVTGLVIDKAPCIPLGGEAQFHWTAQYTLSDLTGVDRIHWSVYDNDPVSDDALVDETHMDVVGTAGSTVTIGGTFTLYASASGVISGPDGSSGEIDPAVFVLIEGPFGIDLGQSPSITVTACPEPSSFMIAAVGIVYGISCRQIKRFKNRYKMSL